MEYGYGSIWRPQPINCLWRRKFVVKSDKIHCFFFNYMEGTSYNGRKVVKFNLKSALGQNQSFENKYLITPKLGRQIYLKTEFEIFVNFTPFLLIFFVWWNWGCIFCTPKFPLFGIKIYLLVSAIADHLISREWYFRAKLDLYICD